MRVRSNGLGRLVAAWLALAACAAGAEPLTLDRLLAVEDLGASALSPDGRHLVIETQAPYDQAPRFDFESPAPSLGRLMIADLRDGAPARLLFSPEAGAGYVAGPFSPNGRSMVVNRWKAQRWDTGVVDLETGSVRWLGLGVDQPVYGRSLQWLSNDALVAIVLEDGQAPLHLKLGWQNQARTTVLWARRAAGTAATLSVVGSGRARATATRQDRRLMRIDLSTGQQTLLATGGFFDLELSPSHRYVAALGEAEPIGLVETPAVRMSAPTRRRALVLVDLTTGAVKEPCPVCTTLIQPMAWAPHTDRLLVYQHDARAAETTGGLVVVDAATGTAAPAGQGVRPDIDYGGEGFATVRADWLGARPIVRARPTGGGRPDWYALTRTSPVNLTGALTASPSDLVIAGDDALLGLVDQAVWRIGGAGEVRRLPGTTGTAWFRPAAFGVGARLAAAPLRTERPWLRGPAGVADLSGRALTLGAEATPLAFSREGLVFEARAPNGVRRVALAGSQGRDLAVVNAAFAQLDLGGVRSVEAPGPGGQVLKSWLYLPPTWRAGQRLPLVVVPYPGSAPQRFPSRFGLTAQNFTPNPPYLAAQGYAVLVPALPRDRERGEPALGLADQILAVVDAVVAQGYADPDRLALWGHSFGGYAALVTATQTPRFKAIIAQAGPSDFIANWGAVQQHFETAPEDGAPNANFMGYNETGQGALKGPPWRETHRYLRNSPLLQADKITTPVMLVYGDQDFVPLSQGQAMFNALYRQDKDATLVTLFGEGHLPTSPANIRALYAVVLPWLADRLGAAPAAARDDSRPSQ